MSTLGDQVCSSMPSNCFHLNIGKKSGSSNISGNIQEALRLAGTSGLLILRLAMVLSPLFSLKYFLLHPDYIICVQ
jgi:hypothetical protein